MTRRKLKDRRIIDRRGFNYTAHIPELRLGVDRRIVYALRRNGVDDRRGSFYPHNPERRSNVG